MGLIDDVFSAFGGGKRLRHNVRSGEQLLDEGTPDMARIAGIRLRQGKDESPDQHEFALAFGGERLGCRQNLGTLRRDLRLGMQVPIRHDGGNQAIIDVRALGGDMDAWGYKPLGEPPADGIADDRSRLDKERAKSTAVTLEVIEASRSTALGMATENVDLRVRVDGGEAGPYETVVKRALVPFYAAHLAEPGSSLLGLVRPGKRDKVTIDWPGSAMADPGVGHPAAAVFAADTDQDGAVTAGEPQDWSAEALATEGADERVAGVDFDTWVAVKAGIVRERVKPADVDAFAGRHGVPAGSWQAAESGWQARVRTDPRLGARFGPAFAQAMKRR